MKKFIVIPALALLAFASCRKEDCTEREWKCTIENWTPEGIVPYWKSVVPFYGTYTQMRKYEADHTYTAPGLVQACHCH